MKIRTFSSLENDVYKVVVQTEDWSENDRRFMVNYGEPAINTGGTFDNGLEVSYVLDDRDMRIMTESPFSQGFDYRDYADAADRAELWRTTMIARITDAVTALRANTDITVREDVVTL